MKIKWLLVGGGVIVLASIAYVGYSVVQTQVISDNAGIRLRSYRQIGNALDTGGKPEAWDAAVFISSGMASRAADTLKGTNIPVGGKKDSPEIVLVLDGMSLTWDVGVIRAKLDLTGTHLATGVKLSVSADADFVVESIEPDPQNADGVILLAEPRIRSLTPGLAAPWTMIRTNAAISELIGLGIEAGARDALKLKVPIRRSFDYATTINRKTDVPVNDKTKLTLEIANSGERLHTDIIYRPIVTPSGLWALGVVTTPDKANTAMDRKEDITESQRAGLDAMRTALVGRLQGYEAKPTDLAVFVGLSIFSKVAAAFNALKSDTRDVKVGSTAINGSLYEKKWRDDVLGDGGIFVTLTNPNAVNATISVGSLQNSWDAQNGQASLTMPIEVDATVDIHMHVDPLIGGGVGTSVGMKGRTTATVKASVTVQQVNLNTTAGAQAGIFLVPDLPCQSARLSARTDGNLIIGPLNISVPPIGANMSMVIGKEQMKPLPVLTSLPAVYPIDQEPKPSDSKIKLSTTHGMQVAFSNFSVSPSAQGVWVGANAVVAQVTIVPQDPKALTPGDLANQAKDLLTKTRPNCDLKSNVEIVVGDIGIGENNDFIRAVGTISKGVQDTQRAALKAAEDAARALEKARADAQAAVIKAAEDAKREADRFLEQRRKDAENALKTVGGWIRIQ